MGTHPIFESDFDCLTDLRVEIVTNRGGTFKSYNGRDKFTER